MADFDLIQTDAQVQSILNDGQDMQGAGAQTTLTTESVLLKDENGNYHKILKSSFTEAIRDTLAGLLVNNDKGTTINQIAAIASGDFGSITPANLASVLGGAGKDIESNTNFNDLTYGLYGYNKDSAPGCSNTPADYGLLDVTGSGTTTGGGYPKIQTFIDNSGNVYIRFKWAGTWREWKKLAFAQ